MTSGFLCRRSITSQGWVKSAARTCWPGIWAACWRCSRKISTFSRGPGVFLLSECPFLHSPPPVYIFFLPLTLVTTFLPIGSSISLFSGREGIKGISKVEKTQGSACKSRWHLGAGCLGACGLSWDESLFWPWKLLILNLFQSFHCAVSESHFWGLRALLEGVRWWLEPSNH